MIGQSIHANGKGLGQYGQCFHRIGEVINAGHANVCDRRIPQPHVPGMIALYFLDHLGERHIGYREMAPRPGYEIGRIDGLP